MSHKNKIILTVHHNDFIFSDRTFDTKEVDRYTSCAQEELTSCDFALHKDLLIINHDFIVDVKKPPCYLRNIQQGELTRTSKSIKSSISNKANQWTNLFVIAETDGSKYLHNFQKFILLPNIFIELF